ncbi:MAG: hypothetical protein E7447_03980 [Ruminococcaceae bacterium]|nr:hypothetical protein [Oscillospiraceae bacterium]
MKMIKLSPKSLILIIVASVLIISTTAVFGVLYAIKCENERLTAICSDKVENAQYLPNIDKIAVDEVVNTRKISTLTNLSASSNVSSEMDFSQLTITHTAFNEIIDAFGSLDAPFDHEYDIFDIKTEIAYLMSTNPSYNEWLDYRSDINGLYFVTYDEEQDLLTILSKNTFQIDVYDSETGEVVTNSDFTYQGTDPLRKEIFKRVEYYHNEDGVEVVECEIIDVLYYHEYTAVGEYQFIKNVKDTSFTKYIITPNAHLWIDGQNKMGYDVDSENPLGTYRHFIQMDYIDQNDVSLLVTSQKSATAYVDVLAERYCDSQCDRSIVTYYRKLNDELCVYNSGYCHGELDFDSGIVYMHFIWDIPYEAQTDPISSDAETQSDAVIPLLSIDDILSGDWACNALSYNLAMNHLLGADAGYERVHIKDGAKPDHDYKNKSSDKIESLKREMYYTDGTNTFSISAGSYYIKKDTDNEIAYSNLQDLPLRFNQTLSSLARNTGMTDEAITVCLSNSPATIDICDQEGEYAYELFIDEFIRTITQNIVDTSYLANQYYAKIT